MDFMKSVATLAITADLPAGRTAFEAIELFLRTEGRLKLSADAATGD